MIEANQLPRFAGRRRGSILVMVAGSLVVIIGMAALALDIGRGLATRTHHQAAADAGVLAGAWELVPPADTDAAKEKAVEWAQDNANGQTFAVTTDDVTTWTHPSGYPAITMDWTQPENNLFGSIFAATSDVRVAASAAIAPLVSASHTLPFGIPAYKNDDGEWMLSDAETDSYSQLQDDPPTPIQLKASSGGSNRGNFLALQLDANGANEYGDNIRYGAEEELWVGKEVDTETGNMVGPTKQNIQYRIGETVLVPVISKEDWDAATGRSQPVEIIGFISVRVDSYTNNGEVIGTFQRKAYPGRASFDAPDLGAYAPILIPNP